MIGLDKNKVKLVKYNKKWETLFKETKQQLTDLIGDYVIDIQHIGSTAVINIKKAKPIIDVAIQVENFNNLEKIQSILEDHKYTFVGDPVGKGGRLFIKYSAPNIATHHIHIIKKGDPQWHGFISFRDKLNNNKSLREKYIKLKMKLKLSHNNRKDYTDGKSSFIEETLNHLN